MPTKPTRYGVQPAMRYINPTQHCILPSLPGRGGRIREMANLVGIADGTLAQYLHGSRLPPAIVKIAVAEVLGRPVELCWTAEVLACVYRGRRGGGNHDVPTVQAATP